MPTTPASGRLLEREQRASVSAGVDSLALSPRNPRAGRRTPQRPHPTIVQRAIFSPTLGQLDDDRARLGPVLEVEQDQREVEDEQGEDRARDGDREPAQDASVRNRTLGHRFGDALSLLERGRPRSRLLELDRWRWRSARRVRRSQSLGRFIDPRRQRTPDGNADVLPARHDSAVRRRRHHVRRWTPVHWRFHRPLDGCASDWWHGIDRVRVRHDALVHVGLDRFLGRNDRVPGHVSECRDVLYVGHFELDECRRGPVGSVIGSGF